MIILDELAGMVVRVEVNMAEYCSECGYQCCGKDCYRIGCDLPDICKAFPLCYGNEGYYSFFGVLGAGNWHISTMCCGTEITLRGQSLGDILTEFINTLNTQGEVNELERDGVHLKAIKTTLKDVKEFSKGVYNALIRTSYR